MNSDATERAPRQSNLELLRILAIFAILGDHYFGGTGIRSGLNGASLWVANLLSSGGRIAVNVFVLIGVWFLVDLPFKGMRPLRLYLTLAFYSIPITLVAVISGLPICLQQILQGLFPFIFMATWYTNAYISLLLMAPYLHKIFEMPKSYVRKIVVLILLLVCLPASLPWITINEYVSDMLWFACIYILLGYIKHHTKAIDWGKKWWYACIAIIGYALIIVFRSLPLPQIASIGNLYRANIKAIPNLLIAYCVFIVFLRLEIGTMKWINKLAKSVFSVYVIHQIPAIWDWEWKMVLKYFQPMVGNAPKDITINCMFSCVVLFVLCLFMDQIKILIVDNWLVKTKVVKRAAIWIESVL